MWTVNFVADSEWWIVSIIAAAAAMWALCNPSAAPKVICFLLIMDIAAYLDGVSLWWVLGVPAGFFTLRILFLLCYLDTDKRRHRGSSYTHSVPNHRDRAINERTHLLPSYVSLPPAETPKKIVPSQSHNISQSLVYTAPKVLPTLPSTSFRVAVDSGLLRPTTPIYSSPADTGRLLYANPTSESLATVAGRQLDRVAPNSAQATRKIPAHTSRSEIDGMFLHASVTAEVEDWYQYDQQIKTESAPYSTTRSVAGVFKCYSCKRKKDQPEEPRKWMSTGICVEIWMSSTGNRYRYRTQLNSQMCNHCDIFVEPDVMKDDYVTKVVMALDSWTGQRSPVKPLQHYTATGPHKTQKCHACRKGICHQKPAN